MKQRQIKISRQENAVGFDNQFVQQLNAAAAFVGQRRLRDMRFAKIKKHSDVYTLIVCRSMQRRRQVSGC